MSWLPTRRELSRALFDPAFSLSTFLTMRVAMDIRERYGVHLDTLAIVLGLALVNVSGILWTANVRRGKDRP